MIPTLEDTVLKDIFLDVLKKKLGNLEILREKLHNYKPYFPQGRQSDPCEAMVNLFTMLNDDYWYQNSLVEIKREQTCLKCNSKEVNSIQTTDSNILSLKLSKKISIQEQINEHIEEMSKLIQIQSYCRSCQSEQRMNAKDDIATNQALIIRINRFLLNQSKNSQDIFPNKIIKVGSIRYVLKCLVTHHGAFTDEGHYTSSFPLIDNEWQLIDDNKRSKSADYTQQAYLLFYEKLEDDDLIPLESEINREEAHTSGYKCISCQAKYTVIKSLKMHVDRNKKIDCKAKYIELNLYQKLNN